MERSRLVVLIPEDVHRDIKIYAAKNRLTMGEVLIAGFNLLKGKTEPKAQEVSNE